MPRYFFRLIECGDVLDDPDGTDLPDLDAARHQATLEARSIMKAEIDEGQLCLACHIEVDDEAGQLIATVPFKEAIQLSGI